jgi:hypothetical protein
MTRYVMRLEVPSTIGYTLKQLGEHAGVEFSDRQIVDVPLLTVDQVVAAQKLEAEFDDGLSVRLRNGPNAVVIHSCKVVER